MAGALATWAVGFVLLAYFKGSQTVPVTALVAGAAIAFVWLNGTFWWLETYYPHIEVAPGRYASRASKVRDLCMPMPKYFS